MAKTYTIVAIDTDALSYAHKGKSSDSNDQDLSAKVKYYLKTAKQNGVQIVMPTIVLAEYLFNYEKTEFDRIIIEMGQEYLLHDFDHLAAKELAELRKDRDSFNKSRQVTGATKTSVKFDQMIAATSILAGAKHILTGNRKDYKSLTSGKLGVIDIHSLNMPPPPPPQQLTLDDFVDDETPES